ncbi:MAG: PqqD family protein [Lentisphaerae bacterium]|nr:PqqD family protein [Lentisphaerota bacterium]
MSLFWKRERPNVDRRQALASVPALNEHVCVETLPDGRMFLRARLQRGGGGFLDRFRPRVDERRYELDAFGAAVVRRIDRKCRVLDIIEGFHQEFRMSRRESEMGVVAFLKILMQRRLITVRISE